jgi:hypothetical protein
MGRYKKNSTRQRRNEEYDAYFDQFEAIGEAPSGAASFLTLFGVMMFTMIVSFLPYCMQYDSSYGGNKSSEIKRDRKPFVLTASLPLHCFVESIECLAIPLTSCTLFLSQL